jgi:RNA polymerase sigma factor (sigma-70 family)
MVTSLSEHSDLSLVSLIDAGDDHAFRELYERYWKKLYNQAFKRLGDVEKCKDIVQDIFLQFWEKNSRGHVLDVAAYLSQAVRFQVITAYNTGKKQTNFELPLELVSDGSFEIDTVYFAKELEAYINAWLTFQPSRRREIFYLRFIDGLETKEISEKLGISQKTVQKTLHKAVSDLRGSLGKFAVLLPILFLIKRP